MLPVEASLVPAIGSRGGEGGRSVVAGRGRGKKSRRGDARARARDRVLVAARAAAPRATSKTRRFRAPARPGLVRATRFVGTRTGAGCSSGAGAGRPPSWRGPARSSSPTPPWPRAWAPWPRRVAAVAAAVRRLRRRRERGLRHRGLPRRELRAARPAGSTAGSVAPADSVLFMPVSAERSEELSGGATGAALRRVGLTVSVSRSCGSRFGAMLVSAALVAVTGTRGRGRREAGFRAPGTGEVFFSFC